MQPSYFSRGFLFYAFATLCLTCFSHHILAEVKLPAIDEKYIDVKIEDPVRDAGYVIGDILNRKISITIKKPYQLVKETLPIVGYEHRYKGQISGIELVNIDTKHSENADSETYLLDLNYQVFKTGRVAKPAALPAEMLKLRNTENKKQIVEYRLPSFLFRVSPLSLIGQIKLDEEMYQFTPPLTIDNSKVITHLKILVGLLGITLLGLLYIFGTRAWLPRMGAPFAKAYRDIKKMPDSPEGIKKAVSRVHESLNKTAGASLFSNNLEQFIIEKPAFAPAKQEIEQFFGLSHQVFFEDASKPLNNQSPKPWLLQLCRTLRDCERGLVPDIANGVNA
jgi:mxaA protein